MHQIDMPVDILYGMQRRNAVRDVTVKHNYAKANVPKLTNIAELEDSSVDDVDNLSKCPSTFRQSYHFTTDFDHVFLQLVDILNTLFNY